MAAARERGFLREAWDLAWPYWKSEEKWSAIGLLVAVIGLNLFAVWLNVRLNTWNNAFYNALQQYNWAEFWRQFGIFGIIAFALIVDAVYSLYLRQILHIRWRRWLTEHFLHRWLDNQQYYRMQLNQTITDNPDQRIADDLDSFATMSLGLSLGLLSSFVTLVSFLSILWVLSGALTIPLGRGASLSIPGYMVFAALIYAVAGTFLTRWIGYPLVQLGFNQQRFEADFRFSLVRLRENAENVAFYGGEAREYDTFLARFGRIIDNWWGIIRRRKKLTWLTTGYGQLAIVFPFIVAAAALFQQGDPARRADADCLGFRPGPGLAVLHRQLLHRDRPIPGRGPETFRIWHADGRNRGAATRGPADCDRTRRRRRRGRSAGSRPAGWLAASP